MRQDDHDVGSSGAQVTTGVRGLSETDLANSVPDPEAVDALDAYAVAPDDAKQHARTLGLKADVTSEQDVARMAEQAMKAFGRIDIVVCNAGVGLYSPVGNLPEKALHEVFEVNFFGYFFTHFKIGFNFASFG